MNPVKLLAVLSLFIVSDLIAQKQSDAVVQQSVRKGVIYKNENSFDIAIHSNGLYLGYNIGKIKFYYLTKYIHFDIGMLKHPKEKRISQIYNQNNSLSRYTFGKQNLLINIRAGRGLIRYYSEKTKRKGVAVGLRMEGGLTVGLLKPYYLDVLSEHDGKVKTVAIKYSPETAADFLDPNHIIGESSFWKGVNEIKFKPGAFGRIALTLDPGAFEKYVQALNVGLQADIYVQRVPILVTDNNPFLLMNFFINLQFGRRK